MELVSDLRILITLEWGGYGVGLFAIICLSRSIVFLLILLKWNQRIIDRVAGSKTFNCLGGQDFPKIGP